VGGGTWSASHPSHLPSRRKPSIYIHWDSVLSPESFWQFGKEKNILTPLGIEPRFLKSPVRCFSLYCLRYPGWFCALREQTWILRGTPPEILSWILKYVLEVWSADQYGGMFSWFSAYSGFEVVSLTDTVLLRVLLISRIVNSVM